LVPLAEFTNPRRFPPTPPEPNLHNLLQRWREVWEGLHDYVETLLEAEFALELHAIDLTIPAGSPCSMSLITPRSIAARSWACCLRTELQILIQVPIRRCGFDPDLCPVGVEFLHQNCREACMDTLPSFAVLGNNRHSVIWSDPHKGIGRQGVLSSSSLCFGESAAALGRPEAENQTGSHRRAGLEKLARVESRRLIAGGHGLPLVDRCGIVNRRPDAYIRAATANVPAHRRVDLVIGRDRSLRQQCNSGHDLLRLAIAALGDVELLSGLKYRLS
jgi:hypothetical protein